MGRALVVATVVSLVLVSTALQAQISFNGGRCDGTLFLQNGDERIFAAGTDPVPESLWLLVLSGAGNVIVASSGGGVSEGLYFHTGDLLFFGSGDPYQLNFQGNGIQIAYGGTLTGSPGDPICGTGSQGPVILLADGAYDVKMQTARAGNGVQVSSYSKATPMVSGELHYTLVTGLTQVGSYTPPACSGSSCCHPQQTVFKTANTGSSPYTVYRVTSTATADFDYALAVSAPLSASAQASPTSGAAPLLVSFTGSALGGASPYFWDWDFGDGTARSSSQNPVHTYTATNLFHPVLQVKDSLGQTAVDQHLVIDSTALEATAGASPVTGNAPLLVAFTGAAEGGKAPYAFAWDFGDGGTSQAQNPSHTYLAEGTVHPVLTVRDADGKTAADAHLAIKVSPPGALVAVANADRTSGPYPLDVNFTGAAGGGWPPFTYAWDFGDGQGSSAQNVAHTYTKEGTFKVILTVQDSKGASATDDHLYIFAGSDFSVQVSATPKAGLAPLTVRFAAQIQSGTPPFMYLWRFGDGTPDSAEAGPSHTYESNGAYQVFLTVSDGAGHSASDSSLSIMVGPGGNTPVVTGVEKASNPFRLKIAGLNFLTGCTVQVDGKGVPQTVYKSGTMLVAKGDAALKAMLPKGVPVCLTVRNPDGTLSDCFAYAR